MVNIVQGIGRSKGWESLKRWGRARKLSKRQGGSSWGVHWSKSNCGTWTDEQEPHTEAMRPDKVAHHTEVQTREGSAEIVDVAGLGTRIFTLPREVSDYRVFSEKSAETIVIERNEPLNKWRTHTSMKGWTLNCVLIREGMSVIRDSLALDGQGMKHYDSRST